ncbi:hypothetical protein B0H10DRAFT_2239404 [Mycena sp. CBHHK59/15]|nr:hypothetical protein B0H10DRAFT_2239404 [Mycena sp. CBHHK59/15]
MECIRLSKFSSDERAIAWLTLVCPNPSFTKQRLSKFSSDERAIVRVTGLTAGTGRTGPVRQRSGSDALTDGNGINMRCPALNPSTAVNGSDGRDPAVRAFKIVSDGRFCDGRPRLTDGAEPYALRTELSEPQLTQTAEDNAAVPPTSEAEEELFFNVDVYDDCDIPLDILSGLLGYSG